MKYYDDYRQQVPATHPYDGFLFKPETANSRPGEKVQHKTPPPPILKPYKDIK